MGRDLGGVSAAPVIVFFTYRVSLEMWRERGIVRRETDVYRRLLPRLGGVTFLTYGVGDASLEPCLGGIRVLPRPARIGAAAMSLLAPWLYRRQIRAAAVLKTNQGSGAWTAVLAKWLFGKPLIVRCGYAWSFHYDRQSPHRWRRATVRLLERLAVRNADRVVVTSEAVGEYLIGMHGCDRACVRIVPNALDTVQFAPDPAVTREPNLVVAVGRMVPEKNFAALVDAVARTPGVRLLLVGDGPERAELGRQAARSGVRVEFAGTVSNESLPRLLNRAALFVLPSHYEGQPKVLLEAMACGLPVLGADVIGIRNVIRHGETGWLCAPTVEGLADGLRALLADGALRQRLGDAARADVQRRHSVEAVAERELAVVLELVG
jgi:glycosyltransferase involved in cell wall biosynthesis